MTSQALRRFTRAELLEYAIQSGAPASLQNSQKDTIVRAIQKGFILSRSFCPFCHIAIKTMANGTVRIGAEPIEFDSDDEAPDKNEADIHDHTQYCGILQTLHESYEVFRDTNIDTAESRVKARAQLTDLMRVAIEGQAALCSNNGRAMLGKLKRLATNLQQLPKVPSELNAVCVIVLGF